MNEQQTVINEQLIAAAPDLLAALQRALPYLLEYDKQLEHYGKTIIGTVETARAAIAKATKQQGV